MSKSSIRWPEARIWTTATWTSARFSARLMSSFVMFTNLVDAIMFIDTLRLRHRCCCVTVNCCCCANRYAALAAPLWLRQSIRCACATVVVASSMRYTVASITGRPLYNVLLLRQSMRCACTLSCTNQKPSNTGRGPASHHVEAQGGPCNVTARLM